MSMTRQGKRTMRNTSPAGIVWALLITAAGLVWMAYAHAHGMSHATTAGPGMYAPPVMYHSPLAGGAVHAHVPHIRGAHVRAPYILRRPFRGVLHPIRFALWHL